MLTVNNLTKSYGSRVLFENVSLRILPGEKIGFIGANGVGKTTFLKILSGSEEFDGGEYFFDDSSSTVSFLSQIVTLKPYNRVYDEVKSGLGGFVELEMKLRAAEEDMIAFSEDPLRLEEAVANYGNLREEFEHAGGDDIEWQIDRILLGLGFSLQDKYRSVSEFSGGWKMRIEFAKLLLKKSDLLILDEPTNHLDMKAISWLEEYLSEYPGAVIIVSHDRYFLNNIVKKVISFSGKTLKVYNGNYDDFVKQQNLERELAEKAYKDQQKRLEKELIFIERFRYKATLASRVKSKEKMISKRDMVGAPAARDKSIHLSFGYDDSHMTTVFKFKDLEKTYANLTVPFMGEAEITAGDRISLIGENGTGKSTLLSMLSGRDKDFSGRLRVHPAVNLKYYLQNQELALNESNTVLEELQTVAPPEMTITSLRNLLGSFLFRGDDVFKRVDVLSGGEKARLALAMTISSPSNVMMLDEPTNHLDIESREALAVALDAYKGTVIIVSHDRYFIDQICNRVFELEDGFINIYEGDYSFYVEKKKATSVQVPVAQTTLSKPAKKAVSAGRNNAAEESVSLEKKLREIEILSGECDREIGNVETLLASPEVMSDSGRLVEMSKYYGELKEKSNTYFAEYESIFKRLSSIRT